MNDYSETRLRSAWLACFQLGTNLYLTSKVLVTDNIELIYELTPSGLKLYDISYTSFSRRWIKCWLVAEGSFFLHSLSFCFYSFIFHPEVEESK